MPNPPPKPQRPPIRIRPNLHLFLPCHLHALAGRIALSGSIRTRPLAMILVPRLRHIFILCFSPFRIRGEAIALDVCVFVVGGGGFGRGRGAGGGVLFVDASIGVVVAAAVCAVFEISIAFEGLIGRFVERIIQHGLRVRRPRIPMIAPLQSFHRALIAIRVPIQIPPRTIITTIFISVRSRKLSMPAGILHVLRTRTSPSSSKPGHLSSSLDS